MSQETLLLSVEENTSSTQKNAAGEENTNYVIMLQTGNKGMARDFVDECLVPGDINLNSYNEEIEYSQNMEVGDNQGMKEIVEGVDEERDNRTDDTGKGTAEQRNEITLEKNEENDENRNKPEELKEEAEESMDEEINEKTDDCNNKTNEGSGKVKFKSSVTKREKYTKITDDCMEIIFNNTIEQFSDDLKEIEDPSNKEAILNDVITKMTKNTDKNRNRLRRIKYCCEKFISKIFEGKYKKKSDINFKIISKPGNIEDPELDEAILVEGMKYVVDKKLTKSIRKVRHIVGEDQERQLKGDYKNFSNGRDYSIKKRLLKKFENK